MKEKKRKPIKATSIAREIHHYSPYRWYTCWKKEEVEEWITKNYGCSQHVAQKAYHLL